jgi:uncharacterized protein
MQSKHGFASLGAADGPVKTAILGLNGARLHNLQAQPRWQRADEFDELERHKAAYRIRGFERSDRAYGYICTA